MQGHRSTIGSFTSIVSMMQEPSSSGTDMNQQTSLNHMQNAVDARLSDYLGSSGEAACLCATGSNVQSFGGWNTGEASSGLNLHNQVNDGLKAEHGQSSSCGAPAEDGLTPEERQFEPNNVTFPVTSNSNLHGNQSRIQPFFFQGSSSNCTNQNVTLNMGHIVNSANRGKGTEACSSDNIHNACGLDREQASFGSASCDHVGSSSRNSGYMVGGDNGSSSSSLVNWGSSCKRKAFESSSGQLCTGASSSYFLDAENSCWTCPTAAASLNASSSLNVSRSSEDIPINNPPVQQNPRNEVRQIASDSFPLIGVMGNVDRPLRSFDRRMNYVQHQESWHFNQSSSRQIPSSHPFNDSLELRLTAGVTAANSSAPQSQSHAMRIPGLPTNTHPFPWSETASSRGASSSTSYNSPERDVQEELNLRIFPRDDTEHPMLVPASSGHDPSNWHMSSGNVNNSGGLPPPSWIASSSSVHSLPNPSWTVHHEVPTQNQQRLSEFSPWSFFPSMSSVSGVHNGHSASSSSGTPSSTQDMSNRQSHPRSASLMARRGDDLSAPHSLRTLAVDIEGRRRLISEIRQVLHAMRRGENLRAEDYLLFDPFIYHGMAEMHDRHRDMRLDVDNMSYEELLALEERIGNVNTGLSADIIMKLMKQRIFVSVMTESSTDLEPCCICQEQYADGDDVGSLDCGHEFHVNCIKQWLMQKNLCPICKTTALAT